MLDYHVIIDLLPLVADLYFSGRIQVSLSGVQRAILLAIGLQRKSIDDLEKELNLPVAQVLAMFIKTIKKFSNAFREIEKAAVEKELPPEPRQNGDANEDREKFVPLDRDLGEEIEEAGDEVISALREKQRELINSLDLEKYALGGTEEDWADALASRRKEAAEGMVVSVKGSKEKKRKGETMKEVLDEYEKSTEKTKKKRHRH
jgi:N-acetyltransferase 10